MSWNSTEGIQRLNRATAKADFFFLANHFESQTNKVFCGVASSTIVLNALRASQASESKPLDKSLIHSSENTA